MKNWKFSFFQPWFILLLLIGAWHQVLEKWLGVKLPLLDNYLDPLLLMPILLHCVLWEKRILYKKGSSYVLSKLDIFLILVMVSVVAEYFFPKWTNEFTADIWDVFCYVLGAWLFHLFANKAAKMREV